jgi:chemotaxis protein histidine kinase CheA
MLHDVARHDPVLGPVMQKMGHTGDQRVAEKPAEAAPAVPGLRAGQVSPGGVVRESSHQLGEQAEQIILGFEVNRYKSILEQLSDPLTPLVLDSLGHGLEPPDECPARGFAQGRALIMYAFNEEGMVNLAIQDDGWVIDAEKMAAKAMALWLISAEEVRRLGQAEKF